MSKGRKAGMFHKITTKQDSEVRKGHSIATIKIVASFDQALAVVSPIPYDEPMKVKWLSEPKHLLLGL